MFANASEPTYSTVSGINISSVPPQPLNALAPIVVSFVQGVRSIFAVAPMPPFAIYVSKALDSITSSVEGNFMFSSA